MTSTFHVTPGPRLRRLFGGAIAALVGLAGTTLAQEPASLAQANQAMFEQMREVHGYNETQMNALRTIFARSRFIGQGNPAIARHPVTPAECTRQLTSKGIDYRRPDLDAICKAPFMAPLYDTGRETPAQASACIDRFEFPNLPCAYPVVWVRAREAAQICAAVGKRLCDAHEWEAGCAGSLEPPDYRFDLAAGQGPSAAVSRMRKAHNDKYGPQKRWAYGPAYKNGVCAAASQKSAGCAGGGWNQCGSNTYPAGAFPDCRGPLDVLDLHGNAAEHMNLPLSPKQMASAGSTELGHTEMKGSWFIFDRYRAHEDWCRWRAPYWHGTRVMAEDSHHNYHLGFRCCKTVAP